MKKRLPFILDITSDKNNIFIINRDGKLQILNKQFEIIKTFYLGVLRFLLHDDDYIYLIGNDNSLHVLEKTSYAKMSVRNLSKHEIQCFTQDEKYLWYATRGERPYFWKKYPKRSIIKLLIPYFLFGLGIILPLIILSLF